MSDKRTEKHFGDEKKEHTKIKHKIFEETLKSSISIANMNIPKFKTSKDYVYIDLFAGAGVFNNKSIDELTEDDKGSILKAIDIIDNHLSFEKSDKVKNHFEEFYVIGIEKDEGACKKLKQTIDEYEAKKINNKDKINIGIDCGDWENFLKELKSIIKDTQWGFIFADPFSTELNIEKLKEFLKEDTGYMDVLIFFNLQTLKRQYGRKLETDIQRLEKVIGLSWEEITSEKDLSEAVKKGIEKHFNDGKKFIVGVAYPVEVSNKLTTMDYFYLILITGSFGVVDNFLKSYANIVSNYKDPQSSLFEEKFIPKEDQTLLDFWYSQINKFLSWKNIIKRNTNKIPTLKNIVKDLNDLRREGRILFEADEKFLYKRNTKDNKKGELKVRELNSKNSLERVRIKILP